ncbi:MAG: aromatic ring-hydroxylating dioxygenase subunit alpha [Rhodobacteraceae bacterium]|nr:aromatic ring-hydroxylating dioxygenase subunit alpha [Paracoccaceae bacterium]
MLKFGAAEKPFSENAAESYTIPAKYYLEPEIFEREKPAIYYRSWLYAGHASQLPEPGCFKETRIHEQSVVLVRGRDRELRAFYNVCRHRGHELVQGEGRTNLFTCPYHAWSYDLDGELKSSRNTHRMQGFDACEFSLKPVRVEEFCGLIFINLDMDTPPFRELVPGLEEEIRRYCPRLDGLSFAQRDSYDVAANWKVLIDNFLECYHCHPAHKDFVSLCDMSTYRSRTHGIWSSHCSAKPRSDANSAYSFETGDVDFGYAGWFVWPNLTIWVYPGEPNISTLQMLPVGPGRTIEHQDWFVPDGLKSPQLMEAMDYQKSILQPEDISLCESVQKGLNSFGYNQGRFVIDDAESELSEHAVHHFQKLVMKALKREAFAPVQLG